MIQLSNFVASFFVSTLVHYLVEMSHSSSCEKERPGRGREQMGKYSEIMISLISAGGWFFPTDWLLFSPGCHRGSGRISVEILCLSHLTPSDSHIRVIPSTNIGGTRDNNRTVIFLTFKPHYICPVFLLRSTRLLRYVKFRKSTKLSVKVNIRVNFKKNL